jgi:hypothetical protein
MRRDSPNHRNLVRKTLQHFEVDVAIVQPVHDDERLEQRIPEPEPKPAFRPALLKHPAAIGLTEGVKVPRELRNSIDLPMIALSGARTSVGAKYPSSSPCASALASRTCGYWVVRGRRGEDPKSGGVRSVPLIDQAARALDSLSQRDHLTESDDRVFLSPTGGAPDDGDVREAFYRALSAAELGHLRYLQPPTEEKPNGMLVAGDGRAGLHGPRRHQDDDALRPPRAEARRRGTLLEVRGGPARRVPVVSRTYAATTDRNSAQLAA